MDSAPADRWRRRLFVVGAVLGGLSVALGAFGAHALGDRIADSALATYETGARYAMYHALAILVVTGLRSGTSVWAAGFFAAGILLFSGSLIALALTGAGVLGAVAPVGGLFLLAGWGVTAWGGARRA